MLGAVIATEDSNLGHVLVLFFMCIVFLCSVQHIYDTVFHGHCTVPLIPVQQGVTFGGVFPRFQCNISTRDVLSLFFMRIVLIFFSPSNIPTSFFLPDSRDTNINVFFFCLYSHPCLCTQTLTFFFKALTPLSPSPLIMNSAVDLQRYNKPI